MSVVIGRRVQAMGERTQTADGFGRSHQPFAGRVGNWGITLPRPERSVGGLRFAFRFRETADFLTEQGHIEGLFEDLVESVFVELLRGGFVFTG